MRLITPIVILLASLLLGAHFLRIGETGLCLSLTALGLAAFSRRAWLRPVYGAVFLWGAFIWANTISNLVGFRLAAELSWHKTAIILGMVLAFNLLALALAVRPGAARNFNANHNNALPRAIAFIAASGLLLLARAASPLDLLLADRYFPGFGGLQIFALGLYAAWICGLMLDPAKTAMVRGRIWGLFSFLFFAQLGLGLAGVPHMLMTGELHMPVPALIVAGPAYRGEGLFMLILFSVSVLMVGPAWCSHLCYIGAWDHYASKAAKRPGSLPPWAKHVRTALLVLVLAAAFWLRSSGLPTAAAVWLAAVFGLGGVAVMLSLSRRKGTMVHCTAYCPMGICANVLGRLNPWRVQIEDGCSRCGKCARVCRYSALTPGDLEKGRPGLSCTLCGDCVNACPDGRLHYTFPGLTREAARTAFIVAAVALHAVFLGVARI